MPAREPLEKVSIRLFKGDKARLDDLFPQAGHNRVIRELVRRTIRQIEERASQRQQKELASNDIDGAIPGLD